MTLRLNREIKAFCSDFEPIRRLLQGSGAVFAEVKEQVDYFYRLPANDDKGGTRRLKLRTEKGNRQLIYYHDRQEGNARTSTFQLWEISDAQLQEVLKAALGIRAVVRKSREMWHRENVIFNLDTVEEVGQILEVEVQEEDGCDIESQVEEYKRLFEPYLGDYIEGSNEDLVVAEK